MLPWEGVEMVFLLLPVVFQITSRIHFRVFGSI